MDNKYLDYFCSERKEKIKKRFLQANIGTAFYIGWF